MSPGLPNFVEQKKRKKENPKRMEGKEKHAHARTRVL